MSLNINNERIRAERLRRAWSQEQLATVAGLGLRTIHRIENTGQCSLESLRSVASAFELLPEDLQAPSGSLNESALSCDSEQSHINALRSQIKSIQKYLTGGVLGALLSLFGLMLADSVAASQVYLDIEGSVYSEAGGIEGSHDLELGLLADEGEVAVIEIAEFLRIELTPDVQDEGLVMLSARVFTWTEGEFVLAASPAMLTGESEKASIHMSLPEGQSLNVGLTPNIR